MNRTKPHIYGMNRTKPHIYYSTMFSEWLILFSNDETLDDLAIQFCYAMDERS